MEDIITEIQNIDFLMIERKRKDGILVEVLVKTKNTGERLIYSNRGDIKVIPLKDGIYLVNGSTCNYIIENTKIGIKMDDIPFANYEKFETDYFPTGEKAVVEPNVELEHVSYKITSFLLEHNLIILRYGYDYILYDFKNQKWVSECFSNIEEIDGKLKIEYIIYKEEESYIDGKCHVRSCPDDILVGEMDLFGVVVNNEYISQKWGMSFNNLVFVAADYCEEVSAFEKEGKHPVKDFDYKEYLSKKNMERSRKIKQ